MYEIRIELNQAASLTTLATPMGGMAALPPGMPGIPGGIYLIFNTATDTRYAGISRNVVKRFNGRMAVVNEFGLTPADMLPIWAWWGSVRTRQFPTPANFGAAFPTRVAGLALANRYAVPGVGTTICPNAIPAVIPGLPPAPVVSAINEVTMPIRAAVGAYQAWLAIPVPRTVPNFNVAFTHAVGFGPPGGVAAAAIGQASAALAATAAATTAGAPPAIANAASLAITACAGGFAPAPSDVGAVVHSYYGGPPLALVPAVTPLTTQNPVVVGRQTSVKLILPGIGDIDLEQVFIRFVLNYLGGGGHVSNGLKIAPMAWPGVGEPICVTWSSCAGAGFGVYERSVMWWGGTF